MPLPLLLPIAGAVLGGIAGAAGSKQSISLPGNTALGRQAYGAARSGLSGLQGLIGQGPGARDVRSATGASRDLAAMLQQLSQTGGIPGMEDLATSQQFAGDVFRPQQVALQQSFKDQLTSANRQAAISGRDLNDPILRAQLAQQQTQQQALLGAEQGSFAAQFAQNLPLQRLGFAGQRADVLGQLSGQAMQNQMSLAGLGSNLLGQERNFRLAQATKTTGGGLGGAISGALGGLGAGASLAGGLGGLSSLFGGAASGGAAAAGAAGGAGANIASSAGFSGGGGQSFGAGFGPWAGGFGFQGANPMAGTGQGRMTPWGF